MDTQVQQQQKMQGSIFLHKYWTKINALWYKYEVPITGINQQILWLNEINQYWGVSLCA